MQSIKNQFSNHRLVLSCVFLYCLLTTFQLIAAEEINIDTKGHILKGYDPVSYFYGKPTHGKTNLNYTYDDAKYLFSSAENRNKFVNDPMRYAPKFGGYCSYGVRMGKKLDIDPLAYAIKDDRLYVLLNRATLQLWLRDQSNNILIAESLWPKLKPKTLDELK